MVSVSNEKWIPYLGTTSLRKLIDSIKNCPNLEIVKAKGFVEVGDRERTEFHEDVGWKEYERTIKEVELDWYGSALWLDRLETRLEECEAHDMNIRSMRIKCEGDERLVESLEKGEWDDIDHGNRVKIENNSPFSQARASKKGKTFLSIPPDSYFYFDFVNKKPKFDISGTDVKKNIPWDEWWLRNNKCEVCGKPLMAHGFQYRSLDVTGLSSKEVNDSVKRKYRPNFDSRFHKINGIVSWIKENITDPIGFVSPKGHKKFERDKTEGWIIAEA